ncbi:hypothetical protein ACFUCH_29975 [Streptomyces olivaceus]|uniref:hypothetical protein n=1 Tax=Streptomyces olivaceus TaxID=47716 RepID=UPI00362A3C47
MTTHREDGPDGQDDRNGGRDEAQAHWHGPGDRHRRWEHDESGSERDADAEADDPLLVVLRPGADFLGPPPGRYREIRRAASRRRLLRAAAGAAATAAAAALIALPLHWAAPAQPTRPTTPLAPAPSGSETRPPASAPSPVPSDPARTPRESPLRPSPDPDRTQRSDPTPSAPGAERSDRPSTAQDAERRVPGDETPGTRRESVPTPTAERGAAAATER